LEDLEQPNEGEEDWEQEEEDEECGGEVYGAFESGERLGMDGDGHGVILPDAEGLWNWGVLPTGARFLGDCGGAAGFFLRRVGRRLIGGFCGVIVFGVVIVVFCGGGFDVVADDAEESDAPISEGVESSAALPDG
jgi:hypothetical protein